MSKHSKPGGDKPHPSPHQDSAQHHHCDIKSSICVRGVIEAKLPPDLENKRDAAEKKKESREKKRFVVEILTLISVIIYAGLTALMYCSTKQSADAATSAAKTAASQLELAERPWVTADFEIAGPLVFDQSGAHIAVSIKLRNVGTTPAIHVVPQIGLFPIQTIENIPNLQKRLGCGTGFPPTVGIGVGTTIFPNHPTLPDIENVLVSPDQIQQGLIKHARPGTRLLDLHLIGCIVYQSSFDVASRYETGFSFAVAAPDKEHPGTRLPVELGISIPVRSLGLFPEFMQIGSYAR
jgi:hypothetical protein